MGEKSQVEWSAELRENGRVVFTTRPSWVLKVLGVVWLLVIAQVLRIPHSSPTEDKFRLVFAGLFLVLAVGSSAWYGWRILQRYPVMTVDQDGIRTGHDRFLPWAQVGTIGFVRGGLGQKRVPIVPKDEWAKEISVDQSAVKDIPAFARWLEGQLAERRAS
ncbi:hypothetical protein [Kribbella sp. CA-293567]|uniref:hypothetical protein n=1 Tax=Kribbella sp. CA-293567 TaxID=3002436 RepID=UPI0022DE0872|nr:hypothetical protein [Kribbella sp. CA-293567]WBQ06750.1 hypothetical protein OX958_08130 [Kribbella sp. CA-293567]